MALSVMDICATFNEMNYEKWYYAIVKTGEGLNTDWWKLISAVADMHPRYGIAEILHASLLGRGKVDSAIVNDVKHQLGTKGITNLANVAMAKSHFESFGKKVESKLSHDEFIAKCNDNNGDKGKYEISREMIENGLANMKTIFDALVKLFS